MGQLHHSMPQLPPQRLVPFNMQPCHHPLLPLSTPTQRTHPLSHCIKSRHQTPLFFRAILQKMIKKLEGQEDMSL
eukprot:7811727-Ditylum_brightwellii.AAC.1